MPGSRLRHALVAGQVAVSLILIVLAGLLARGVNRALSVDTGFELRGLYAIVVDVPAGVSTSADRANVMHRLSLALHSAARLDAGLTMVPPFSGAGFNHARASHMSTPVPVQFNKVDAGYFPTLGVLPVAGRSFRSAEDRTNVIVNARLARAFWKDERAAVGQPLMFLDERRPASGDLEPGRGEGESEMRTGTVVGVVPTLQSLDIGVQDGATVYLPLADDEIARASLVVRSPARQPLERLVASVTRGSDATAIPASITERVLSRTYPARVASVVTIAIGVLTLFVAAAGVYGIVAHAVASRTYEIGIHAALGAPRVRIVRLVVGSSFRAIGSGAGLAGAVLLVGAVFASDALDPLFFGIRLLDPLAVGMGLCVLAGITGAAAYVPARRALGVEPIEALRRV